MAKPQITKLTKEELNGSTAAVIPLVKQVFPSAQNVPIKHNPEQNLQSSEYLKKLKQEDLDKFFKPFDCIAVVKYPENNPEYACAICKDFSILFSDYESTVQFEDNREIFLETPQFDLDDFLGYCAITNQSPEQIIDELLTVNLFGKRFASYAKNKKKAQIKINKIAFASMSPKMQKTLTVVNEKHKNSIEATNNKLTYGDYKVDPSLY